MPTGTALRTIGKAQRPHKPPTRVVSLWLPNFSIDRLNRRRPCAAPHKAVSPADSAAGAAPQVTVLKEKSALRIAAANPVAQAAGIAPGLTLADARALVPGVQVDTADGDADVRALAALAGWCGRYTPWTAAEADDEAEVGGGGIWLDISGCAHLFGGEAGLLEDLVGRLEALGFMARAAAADTPGAAWAMARFGLAAGALTTIVPPGGARPALAGLPAAALRLAPEIAAGLSRLGLRRTGDLYDLPRGPLVTRFGDSLIRRVDQALGRVAEPISPREGVPVHRVRLAFAEPIGRAEDIEGALARLLGSLCDDLHRDAQGVRRLELACYRVDGETARVAIGTSRPVRDVAHLQRLLCDRIVEIDPGFGIDVMAVRAVLIEPLSAAQLGLAQRRGPGVQDSLSAAADGAMDGLVDRLANRLGPARVVRLGARESYVPERAVFAVPAVKVGRGGGEPRRVWDPGTAWFVNRPRPISLFHPPQPIEVMAPVPDDPPVLFRWRRIVHRVVAADGPERIAPEWWAEVFADKRASVPAALPDSAQTRDYYHLEDEDGGRYWLYRNGLYRPDQGTPCWYLHGIFA